MKDDHTADVCPKGMDCCPIQQSPCRQRWQAVGDHQSLPYWRVLGSNRLKPGRGALSDNASEDWRAFDLLVCQDSLAHDHEHEDISNVMLKTAARPELVSQRCRAGAEPQLQSC